MFKIVDAFSQLDFAKLTKLYIDDLEAERKNYYAYLDENEGILEAENDLYNYLKDCFFKVNKGFYAVLEEQGLYISAVRFEPYRDGLLLNALMTDKDYRGQGFGSVLLEYALSFIDRKFACNLYSHIHNSNASSIGIHGKYGFSKYLDYAILLDGSVCSDHNTYIRVK